MANCSFLAILLGAHFAGYLRRQREFVPGHIAQNTEQLGVGSLLHDVGKLNMTDEMRGKCIFDPESDPEPYPYHVKCGCESVRERLPPIAANTVSHHRERFDGSGFSGRTAMEDGGAGPLDGTQIHVFSRIAAVVDTFDRLLCHGGKPVPTIAAINALKSPRFNG